MSSKKYKFTGKTINKYRKTLKQIIRISDDLIGGYIEFENNLSHEGDCWVHENAYVYENARVYGNANVSGNALVFGNARLSGNAKVYENARVYRYARVGGNARVTGDALVSGDAEVFGNSRVSGNAEVFGNAEVYGDAIVSGNAEVFGNARVYRNAYIVSPYCIINITGLKYSCTVTSKYVKYGCELILWEDFDDKVKELKVSEKLSDYDFDYLVLQAKMSLDNIIQRRLLMSKKYKKGKNARFVEEEGEQ